MRYLAIIFLILIVSPALAGFWVPRGTALTSPTATATCSSSASSMLYYWPAEDVDVAGGTPEGCSVSDEVAAVNGSPVINTTWAIDGTKSMVADANLEGYEFDWALPAEGSMVLHVNVATFDAGGQLFYWGTGTNRMKLQMSGASDAIDFRVDWEGNNSGTYTGPTCNLNGETATGYKIILKWASATGGVDGEYLYIKCDTTEGPSYTTQIIAHTVAATPVYLSTTGTADWSMDAIKVWNYWTTGDPE